MEGVGKLLLAKLGEEVVVNQMVELTTIVLEAKVSAAEIMDGHGVRLIWHQLEELTPLLTHLGSWREGA